jgi:pimeloyl-ACP methyl ester carboxylesterase
MYTAIRILLIMVFAVPAAAEITFRQETVQAGGQSLQVEMGELRVPEDRANPKSRTITLRLARLRSTSPRPGHPIVYLAGGPGGSGIGAARSSRLPLFLAMREFGDVIAFDQRGTGSSEPDLGCKGNPLFPLDRPLDRARGGAALARMIAECAERAGAKGIDLNAYNTRASAADLEDLRKALGAQKLVLWGISYGTHLAFATMRDFPRSVDRVILAGIEGPDDTYKLPSDQQTLLEQIALLAPGDLLASIRSVLREMEKSPKRVPMTHPVDGRTAEIVLGPLDFRLALAQMLEGPDSFAGMADFVERVEGGDWTALALQVLPFRLRDSLSLMTVAMDCASGQTAARRAVIAEESKRTILGDAINLPFPEVCEGVQVHDLGDEFRAPIVSEVPALLISGTLDGRTRPRQAEEARLGLTNAEHLVIDGAGHSDPLFLSSPKILEAMKSFMRGERLGERLITLPAVKLRPVRKVVALPDAALQRFVGTYRIDPQTTRRVVRAGSLLYTIRGENAPLPLRPLSPTTFFYEGAETWVEFETDPHGAVTAMVLHTSEGQPQRAARE